MVAMVSHCNRGALRALERAAAGTFSDGRPPALVRNVSARRRFHRSRDATMR
jgi:hypothetical protein